MERSEHSSPSLRRALGDWHRGHPEKRVAGVCCAVAAQLGLPLPLVRAGFLVLAVLPSFGAGLALYLALWFVTPPEQGAHSGLERVIAWVDGIAMGVYERPRDRAEREEQA